MRPTKFLNIKNSNESIIHKTFISLLLPACKTVERANLELGWIKQELPESSWLKACQDRNRLMPLQYILGNQPFGSLDIKCTPNVLIPRNDTEDWCIELQELINNNIDSGITIADICTGTGCIALSLAESQKIETAKGFDISTHAINLSLENKIRNKSHLPNFKNIGFQIGDIFNSNILNGEKFDLITSNPPYILEEDLLSDEKSGGVEESVKIYEPMLALKGDCEFYEALVSNVIIPSECKAFVFELGYMKQAEFTMEKLKYPSKDLWESGLRYDSGNNIRNIIAWNAHSDYKFLSQMVSRN